MVRLRRQQGVEVESTKSSPVDIVTEVDRAAEALIFDRLMTARPDDGFVGEEGASSESTSGVVWIVDPIDGTVNYLYGLPHFAVSIAAERGVETTRATVGSLGPSWDLCPTGCCPNPRGDRPALCGRD